MITACDGTVCAGHGCTTTAQQRHQGMTAQPQRPAFFFRSVIPKGLLWEIDVRRQQCTRVATAPTMIDGTSQCSTARGRYDRAALRRGRTAGRWHDGGTMTTRRHVTAQRCHRAAHWWHGDGTPRWHDDGMMTAFVMTARQHDEKRHESTSTARRRHEGTYTSGTINHVAPHDVTTLAYSSMTA